MLAYITVIALLTYAVAAEGKYLNNVESAHHIAGEYLVVLKSPAINVDKSTYVDEFINKISKAPTAVSVLQKFEAFESPILHVKTGNNEIQELRKMAEVKVIDANLHQRMIQQCSSQPTGSDLWGLSRISAQDMPDYETATYNFDPTDGENTRVYILDTGIRVTHNDFGGRAAYGTNIVEPGSDPADGNGHGTHCAGIVAGIQYGVSKGTTVVAVKTLSDLGFGSISQIIAGLNWAIEDATERGIRGIMSMSLGGSKNSALDAAVESAITAGFPVAAAAGNGNQDACLFSPGGADGVITMAGTEIADTVASSTNWGPCVDMLAPSRNIRSASHENDSDSRVISGSSMATAFAAGEIANYLSMNPEATPAEALVYLQESATKDVIDLGGRNLLNLLLYASCE